MLRVACVDGTIGGDQVGSDRPGEGDAVWAAERGVCGGVVGTACCEEGEHNKDVLGELDLLNQNLAKNEAGNVIESCVNKKVSISPTPF
jgi:hypothetical protein